MLNLLPIHNLARAIVRTNDQLLLCSSNKGKHPFYFLVGGHIEVGETAAQALKRELQEELGMSLRIGSFLGCVEYQFTLPPGSTKCHNQEFNFIFDVQVTPEEAAALACHEEHINIQWIEFSKLSSINLKPTGLDHYIAAWLNNTSSNAPRFITLIE